MLSEADRALARLDSLGDILPNVDLFIAMFVRKEAVLSSQIEGTQASLEDLFQYESGQSPEKVNDVDEVVNYIKALNYGMERLGSLPMSNRLIKEIHEVLLKGVRGALKTPGEFKRTQNWIGHMELPLPMQALSLHHPMRQLRPWESWKSISTVTMTTQP